MLIAIGICLALPFMLLGCYAALLIVRNSKTLPPPPPTIYRQSRDALIPPPPSAPRVLHWSEARELLGFEEDR